MKVVDRHGAPKEHPYWNCPCEGWLNGSEVLPVPHEICRWLKSVGREARGCLVGHCSHPRRNVGGDYAGDFKIPLIKMGGQDAVS